MKKFFHNNGILLLIVALLLAGITFVVSRFTGGLANPLANVWGVITTPVRSAATGVTDWIEGIYADNFQMEQMKAELESLRLEVAQLQSDARKGEDALVENENLRAVLGLREKRRDFVFESATITGSALSNWESTFTISKGTVHGVQPNHCVVDAYGNLVGIVSEAGLNWSTVVTVVDTDIELGGLISRTDTAAILEGDFTLMGQSRLKLTYLPEHAELIAGDVILTSGKGGVYPSGLVVGLVESLHEDPSGMTRYAVVSPSANLTGIKQVFVIKEFDIVE